MDVESGMSGKNRNAVHFTLAKGREEEQVQKSDGGAEALQNCWALPHSVPASRPHWALRPQAAKFNKTISELETQETTSSEKQNGKIGSVHRKKSKKTFPVIPLGKYFLSKNSILFVLVAS